MLDTDDEKLWQTNSLTNINWICIKSEINNRIVILDRVYLKNVTLASVAKTLQI